MIPVLEFRNKPIRKPGIPQTIYNYKGIQRHILHNIYNGRLKIKVPSQDIHFLSKYRDFFQITHSPNGFLTIIMHECIEEPPIDEWSSELLEAYNRIIETNIYYITKKLNSYQSVTLDHLYYRNFMDVIYTYFADKFNNGYTIARY